MFFDDDDEDGGVGNPHATDAGEDGEVTGEDE